jgi:hypothetical protein
MTDLPSFLLSDCWQELGLEIGECLEALCGDLISPPAEVESIKTDAFETNEALRPDDELTDSSFVSAAAA